MTRTALTIFIDCVFCILAIFILLPHQPAESKDADMVPPGSVVVIAEWPTGLDYDVDLWVRAPDDVPVGYSNKGSKFFNLLRDDLGSHRDSTSLNIEYSFSRGQPVGEYQAPAPFGTSSWALSAAKSNTLTEEEMAQLPGHSVNRIPRLPGKAEK